MDQKPSLSHASPILASHELGDHNRSAIESVKSVISIDTHSPNRLIRPFSLSRGNTVNLLAKP